MGTTGVSEFGGSWDSHFELLIRHECAISFASLCLSSRGGKEKEGQVFWSSSIRRSASASMADKSHRCFGGSRPRARSASARRSFDATSFERLIGTAWGLWVILPRSSCVDARRGLSGVGTGGAGPCIRSFLVKVLKKDLERFSRGAPLALWFATA
jgi:hypothetical protein